MLKLSILFVLIGATFAIPYLTFNPETDVDFLLRTRYRSVKDAEVVTFDFKEGLEQTSFDPKKPIVFQIHGYLEDPVSQKHHIKLSEAILEKDDVNLFAVDWHKGGRHPDYLTACLRSFKIAKVIADFILYIDEKYEGIDFMKITAMGFSLGGGVIAYIGKNLGGRKIGKVIGLDAAVHQISPNPKEQIAEYVECFHTSYAQGYMALGCHSNFFFNGGVSQPGCGSKLNHVCHHARSIYYYAESLSNQKAFYGKKCDNAQKAEAQQCDSEPGAFAGNDQNLENKLEGFYNVKTNAQSPYGQGKM